MQINILVDAKSLKHAAQPLLFILQVLRPRIPSPFKAMVINCALR